MSPRGVCRVPMGMAFMKNASICFLLLFWYAFPAVSAEEMKDDYQKGMEYFNERDYNRAIDAFQRHLRKVPNQAPVYNLLGLTYLKQNESIASAIGSFEQAIRIDPQYAEAYFNLASTYAGPGNDPAQAAAYFKKTLKIDPQFSRAYFGLGWFTLTHKQKPKKAMKLFKKTIKLFPDFAEAYYGLGLAYVQMGKRAEALEPIYVLRTLHREDLAGLVEMALRNEVYTLGEKDEAEKTGETAAEPAKEEGSGEDSEVEEVYIHARGRVVPQ